VRHLVALFCCARLPEPEVRFIDTVCSPPSKRQNAAIELAQHQSVLIVIGGAQATTRVNCRTCRRYSARVHHVQTASDLCTGWFADADTVGVTAGTFYAERALDEVEQWLPSLPAPNDRHPTPAQLTTAR